MSEYNSSITRSRRPKRLPARTSDDNVLGISWKEERELRKAMYVSLRQQNQPPNGPHLRSRRIPSRQATRRRSPTMKSAFKVNSASFDNPFRDRIKQTAQSKLRAAKLRATSRLHSDHTTVDSKSRCTNGFHNKKRVAKTENEAETISATVERPGTSSSKRRQRTSSIPPNQALAVLSVARSIVRARLNGYYSKISRTHAPNVRSPVGTPTTKRPTLMSASNDSKITSTYYKRPLSPKRSRLRSPVKFTAISSSIPRTNGRNCKSKLSPSEQHSVSSSTAATKSLLKKGFEFPESGAIRPERNLFSTPDTPASVLLRRTPDIIPRELCQDPEGRPVSVHDFVEFICYRGSPCLDPKLEWFNQAHANSAASESSDSPKHTLSGCRTGKDCPSDETKATRKSDSVQSFGSSVQACSSRAVKAEDSLVSASSSRSFSIGSKVCVAKKLASAHPPDGSVLSPTIDSKHELSSDSSKAQETQLPLYPSPVLLQEKRNRTVRDLHTRRSYNGTPRSARRRR